MAAPWMPGAIVDRGAAAGYVRGRNNMLIAVEHFTVGTNSYGIGINGYFHLLFPKVGAPWQFAEIDALTWHAGPFNPYGPGAEFERLGYHEPLTPDQLHYGRIYHEWMHDDWHMPLALYDGPRFEALARDFRGFVNHGDLDNQRSDGLTREEWDAMTGTPKHEELPMACLVQTETAIALVDGWVVEGLTIEQVGEYQAKGVPGPFARSNDWLGRVQAGPVADSFDEAAARERVRSAILNSRKGTSSTRFTHATIGVDAI